jgi:hypothetical protein
MKRLLLVVLLLCQIELANAKSGRSKGTAPGPVSKTAQGNIFEGRSQPLDPYSRVAIDITLPMHGQDPDEGLREEAVSDGISKCSRVFTYCKVIESTFRRERSNHDNSVYGVILVRGNNRAPEPVEFNGSLGNSMLTQSTPLPPKGSICIFVPHSPSWIDFLDDRDSIYYEMYIYYADTGKKSKSYIDPFYRELSEVPGIFSNYKEKGLCESFRIEEAD